MLVWAREGKQFSRVEEILAKECKEGKRTNESIWIQDAGRYRIGH